MRLLDYHKRLKQIPFLSGIQCNKKSTDILNIFTLSFLGILISIPQLNAPMDFAYSDAFSRAMWSYHFYTEGIGVKLNQAIGGAWLPIHPIILASSMIFKGDPIVSMRTITLIINSLSIAYMYLYAKKLFQYDSKSTKIAILAGILYLFSPFRLLLATQTLSESISVFFLLLILLLMTNKILKLSTLIVLLTLINTACGIRFEFWLLLPIIWYRFFQHNELKYTGAIISVATSGLFCIFWSTLNYIHFGNFLYFLTDKLTAAYTYPPQIPYNNLFFASRGWIDRLGEIMGFSCILLALFGIIKTFTVKEKLLLPLFAIVIPFYFLLTLIFQVYFGTMEVAPHRYLFPVFTGLIPFLSFGFISFYSLLNRNMVIKSILWIIIFIFVGHDLNTTFQYMKGGLDNLGRHGSTRSELKSITNYVLINKDKYKTKKFIYISYIKNEPEAPPEIFLLTKVYDMESIPLSQFIVKKQESETVAIIRKERSENFESYPCDGKVDTENIDYLLCVN